MLVWGEVSYFLHVLIEKIELLLSQHLKFTCTFRTVIRLVRVRRAALSAFINAETSD